MIKTIQLLEDSFSTYKSNFIKIFNMTWPIVLLTIVAQYYVMDITRRMEEGRFDLSYILMTFIIYLFSVLFVGLFLVPALSRSIQKNEDNGVFDVKEGYDFQKKNIWKFVMVNIWGMLYILKRCAIYILISIGLFALLLYIDNTSKSSDMLPVVLSIFTLIGLTLIVATVLNITRFMFYKNIFFSKDDILPRDAVKESMSLGVLKNNEIWKIIFAMITLVVAVEIVIQTLGSFVNDAMINLIAGTIINVFFSMPYMLIIISKGYTRVRGDSVLSIVEATELVTDGQK